MDGHKMALVYTVATDCAQDKGSKGSQERSNITLVGGFIDFSEWWSWKSLLVFQVRALRAAAEDILTDDECPSDVDMNDPFFAEEIAKPG
uniref:Uncharacterized protein n=1 Tax=Sphaerodactylus townsendi TaxID=933632 RepID=A0ACB8GE27_9SAUR